MSEASAENVKPVSNRKAVFVVALLFSIFLVPYTYVMYLYKTGDMPEIGTTEKGTFLAPKINISDMPLQMSQLSVTTENWKVESIKGQWGILNFVPNNCEKTCLDRLFNTQQVLKALTRYKGRSEQIAVITGNGSHSEELKTVIGLKDSLFVIHNGDELSQYILSSQGFSEVENLNDYIFIMDPEGSLLIYYSAQNEMKEMLRDLKRLLKVSAAGYHSDETLEQ